MIYNMVYNIWKTIITFNKVSNTEYYETEKPTNVKYYDLILNI